MNYISVPEPLRELLGNEGSDALVEVFNSWNEQSRRTTMEIMEERFHRHLAEEPGAMFAFFSLFAG